jgi:hypothetical protein
MTTDTTPAAPTAAGYAAALALIDSTVTESSLEVLGFPVMLADPRVLTAIVAAARASVAYDEADLAADEIPFDIDADAFDAIFTPIEARRVAALDAYNAAVADLVALARATAAAQGGGE